MRASKSAPASLVVVTIFAIALLLPIVLEALHGFSADNAFIRSTELRVPASFTALSRHTVASGAFQSGLEHSFDDAFPFRTAMIRAYGYAKYAWFGGTASDQVLRGRDGWLFLARDERSYIDGQPTDAALAQLAAVYATRAAWCRTHRIRYAFVLAPNKSTVYPGMLPDGLRPVTPSGADRLLSMLRAQGVEVIDTRSAVTKDAAGGDVYSHGDTHWNGRGAYAAQRAIVAALRSSGVTQRIDPSSVHEETVTSTGGDLLAMSGVSGLVTNRAIEERFPSRAQPRDDPAVAAAALPPGAYNVRPFALDDPSLPTLVLFGDSFSEGLAPYLAESFRRSLFLHALIPDAPSFNETLLTRIHPTIVLQELVERSLVEATSLH